MGIPKVTATHVYKQVSLITRPTHTDAGTHCRNINEKITFIYYHIITLPTFSMTLHQQKSSINCRSDHTL